MKGKKKTHSTRVASDDRFEREQIMPQWDNWCRYIAKGGTASWPRDEFECLLDAYDEAVAERRFDVLSAPPRTMG